MSNIENELALFKEVGKKTIWIDKETNLSLGQLKINYMKFLYSGAAFDNSIKEMALHPLVYSLLKQIEKDLDCSLVYRQEITDLEWSQVEFGINSDLLRITESSGETLVHYAKPTNLVFGDFKTMDQPKEPLTFSTVLRVLAFTASVGYLLG